MYKFLMFDLPVLLNVDIETYQIALSIYFLIIFIGMVSAKGGDVRTFDSIQKIEIFKFVEIDSPLVSGPANPNFARGP
ncbi:MAG: hypothetical protein HY280_01380 [Nitrospinae bacterium]|nr:hypothetical protein [Nitrospinota bacterium]